MLTTVGSGVKLPAVAAGQDDPCIAFSVGVDADEANSINALDCKGDVIRINGEYFFKLSKALKEFYYVLINSNSFHRWFDTLLSGSKSYSNSGCHMRILFQYPRSQRRCYKISPSNLWWVYWVVVFHSYYKTKNFIYIWGLSLFRL